MNLRGEFLTDHTIFPGEPNYEGFLLLSGFTGKNGVLMWKLPFGISMRIRIPDPDPIRGNYHVQQGAGGNFNMWVGGETKAKPLNYGETNREVRERESQGDNPSSILHSLPSATNAPIRTHTRPTNAL